MLAPLLALLLAAPAQACPPLNLRAARFVPGEQLRFRLDALGAEVGWFDVALEAAPTADRPRAALLVRSHAKTSAFLTTNFGQYRAFATSLVGADLAPLRYKEEADEGDTHKSQDVEFPARDGKLQVNATRNGQPDPVQLDAGEPVRDLLSTLYFLRAHPLRIGHPLCAEVYTSRRVWAVKGQVGAREQIDTPLGRFAAVRLDMTATRLDDPNVKRSAHVWVTDDDRRLPLVAVGEVKGKAIRAQLIEASGAGLKTAATKPERRGAPRVGAAIGR